MMKCVFLGLIVYYLHLNLTSTKIIIKQPQDANIRKLKKSTIRMTSSSTTSSNHKTLHTLRQMQQTLDNNRDLHGCMYSRGRRPTQVNAQSPASSQIDFHRKTYIKHLTRHQCKQRATQKNYEHTLDDNRNVHVWMYSRGRKTHTGECAKSCIYRNWISQENINQTFDLPSVQAKSNQKDYDQTSKIPSHLNACLPSYLLGATAEG